MVEMYYGDYQFRPVPFLEIERGIFRTEDLTPLGKYINVNVEGTLISATGGYSYVDDLKDELEENLTQDGLLFLVECDGEVIISGYPIISDSLKFGRSRDNEVFTCPYTVSFRFEDTDTINGNSSVYGDGSDYIENFSENWQVEFGDKAYYNWTNASGADHNHLYELRVTHTLNAKGRRRYDDSGLTMPAWQQARNYLMGKLGLDSQFVMQSGVLNVGVATTGIFDHVRNVNIDEVGGTCNVVENFLVLASGAVADRRITEDFTVT